MKKTVVSLLVALLLLGNGFPGLFAPEPGGTGLCLAASERSGKDRAIAAADASDRTPGSGGFFSPNGPAKKSGAALHIEMLLHPPLREKPKEPPYPTLSLRSPAEDSFFDNAAMLGNSLAQGFMLKSGIENMDYFCYQCLTVEDSDSYVQDLCRHQYDRVYIEYGVNELFWEQDRFIEGYVKLIERIRAAMPEADIYVMALTPVTEYKSLSTGYTMARISSLNAALLTMCGENKCWYLDVCGPLLNDEGFLPDYYAGWDWSPHLSNDGYMAMADILRRYYA